MNTKRKLFACKDHSETSNSEMEVLHGNNSDCRATRYKTRIDYWDVAKGITILLMIMGHVQTINPYIRAIIFSYHMPLFFIANAYFIKNYNVKECIRKGAKSLLLPYCITCLICAVINILYSESTVPNYIVFLHMIRDMLGGISGTSTCFKSFGSVWMIWFIPCLFAARLVYVMLMNYLQKLPALVQCGIFFILSGVGILIGEKVAFLPWSFDISLVALSFMWIGDTLHKRNVLDKYNRKLFWSALIAWGIIGSQKIYIELAMRYYPKGFLCIIGAITGSIVVVYFSKVLLDKLPMIAKGFIWCGKNTLIILIIHTLELRYFDWNQYVFSWLPLNNTWIGIFFVKAIAILIITYMVTKVIQYFTQKRLSIV